MLPPTDQWWDRTTCTSQIFICMFVAWIFRQFPLVFSCIWNNLRIWFFMHLHVISLKLVLMTKYNCGIQHLNVSDRSRSYARTLQINGLQLNWFDPRFILYIGQLTHSFNNSTLKMVDTTRSNKVKSCRADCSPGGHLGLTSASSLAKDPWP